MVWQSLLCQTDVEGMCPSLSLPFPCVHLPSIPEESLGGHISSLGLQYTLC